ncbi:2OG-Fe(II) oxygenase [Arenimonas sp.]|uniref:2OG-Fe(II) oxygenase n=1 Tax=Arenimonas sp. TaxID=1872635 RepID=UPI0039E2DDBC
MPATSAIADSLRLHGVAEAQDLFPMHLLQALRQDALALHAAGRLREAATGRGTARQQTGLRGDSTLWLDDPQCGDAAADFLSALDGLRLQLNRELLLGLHEVEAHYALYPAGAGYVRHRDRFHDDDARVLSLVCYLNPDWPDGAGGALRLHFPDGAHDMAPRLGTTVLFLSDEIEHEVLPATQSRLSIAAWFRRRT